MKRLLTIAIATLLLTGCSQTPDQEKQSLYEKGLAYVTETKLAEADAAFGEMTALDSSDVRALYGRALVFENRLMYFDALNVFLMARDFDTTFMPARIGAWRAYSQLGYPLEAAGIARAYRRQVPDDWQGARMLAISQIDLGKYKEAGRTLATVNAPDAKAEAILNLVRARALLLDGERDSAQTVFADAIGSAATDSDLLHEAADYLEAAGLIDSAMVLSRQATGLSNADFASTRRHFHRLLRHNYFFESRSLFTGLKEKGIEEPITLAMELQHLLVEMDRQGLREIGPRYRGMYSRNFSAAIYEMDSRGKVGDQLSIFQDIAAMSKVAHTTPTSPEFLEFYEYYLRNMHYRYEISPTALKRFNGLEPARLRSLRLRLDIAKGTYISGEHKRGLDSLRRLVNQVADDPLWLTEIGKAYSHFGVRRYDLAEGVLTQALEINPRYRPAMERYVGMRVYTKEWDKALNVFDRYPHFEQNYPELAMQKAKCLVFAGEFDRGMTLLENSLAGARGNLSLIDEIYERLLRNERLDEVARLDQLLTEVDGDNADALALIAQYNAERGNFEKSVEYADRAVEIVPDNAKALVHKAWALYNLGRKDDAIALFKDNSLKFRGHADNLLYYSRMLSLEGGNGAQAANTARESVFAGWGMPKYLLNLSFVYFQNGRFNLARSEAKKALFVDKTDPQIYFRMGIAMYREGHADAKKSLEKAVELGLKGDDLKAAQAALKML